MRTHRNRLWTQQAPKNDRRRCALDEEARPRTMVATGAEYIPWMSLRDGASISYSGTINKRRGWYCPDCGYPLQDVEIECCWRCGSTEQAEWRDGK